MSESEILKKINNTPELLSLLYDMDLLPEQTSYSADRRYYRRTLLLGAAWPILSDPDPLLELVRELRDITTSMMHYTYPTEKMRGKLVDVLARLNAALAEEAKAGEEKPCR